MKPGPKAWQLSAVFVSQVYYIEVSVSIGCFGLVPPN